MSQSYDRRAAVAYAEQWALGRNPAYYDFSSLGGDCTNFVSQCLYAGCGVMNYSDENGWYYLSLDNRAPAWTSVSALYRFLITNRGPGPYARIADRRDVLPGDVIQLGDADGTFYHSLFVLDASPDEIYIAAHSYDALWRPLSSYQAARKRYLHIHAR
jgi:hypothetical protein